MSVEKGPSPVDQQTEVVKEQPKKTPTSNTERPIVHRDLKKEEEATRKQDQAKIAEIRESLGLEQAKEDGGAAVRRHLQEYLGIEQKDAERIELLKVKNLPERYQNQRDSFNDKRLEGVTIAVIPDDLWVKGTQPSESSAERQMISIKQSYFAEQENPDEIAWLCHELAHCQNFLDSESAKAYEDKMQQFAFDDLKTEYAYPNNKVEETTFTKQFGYLKKQGKSREDVLAMLGKYYSEEDFPFFNRLLDSVYKK